jgi:hypothetical protein
MTSAFDYFTCLLKYRVVLCKICHYCVWPDNARTHLREKHSRLPKAERALVCDELQTWQEVSHSHEHFEVPQAVDRPVQGLRIGEQYISGARLQREADPGQRRHFTFLSRDRRTHGSLFFASAFSTQDATQATSQCFRRGDSRTVTLNGEPQIRIR